METEVPKTSLHQPLEHSRGIGESTRHPFTLIETQWSHCECCQWFTFLIHPYLPVSQLQVEGREPLRALQAIKCFVDMG